MKPQTLTNKNVGCHGDTGSDEESSALIADSARYAVLESFQIHLVYIRDLHCQAVKLE